MLEIGKAAVYAAPRSVQFCRRAAQAEGEGKALDMTRHMVLSDIISVEDDTAHDKKPNLFISCVYEM